MAYGDFAYTPAVNQTVIAECWGAGGGGRIGQGANVPGCGGGGGAYSRKAGIFLPAGVPQLVRVGGPYNVPSNHESLFRSDAICLADFGISAAFQSPGTGGLAANGNGDVKFSGGNGAPYPGNISSPGGGGASSAGRGGNGNDGSFPAPGATVVGGGPGGVGGSNPDGDGAPPPSGPGGGGGGGATGSLQTNPGGGFEGAVVLWLDLGVWPPVGQTPLASYGSPPANPTSPKLRKSAMYM